MARFTRRARLLSPPQFKRVFQQGRKLRSTSLMAVVAANEVGQPRLGLAIARKALPDAVDRNRVKRVARESFRAMQETLPSCDVVLLANPQALKASNDTLRTDLNAIWTRVSQQWPRS